MRSWFFGTFLPILVGGLLMIAIGKVAIAGIDAGVDAALRYCQSLDCPRVALPMVGL